MTTAFAPHGSPRFAPRLLPTYAAALAALALAPSAQAQAAAPPEAAASAAAGTGEPATQRVEITGTLRRTDALKTPLAVSAIGEKDIENQGAVSISDLMVKVPGLQIMDRGPNDKKFAIRGIQNDVLVGKSTVGIYVDDFPISQAGAQIDLNLFDVERVEVLRGPQGTLYGASSMTGTLKYITNKPDPGMFDAAVRLGAAVTQDGAPSYSAQGMLNVPLSEGAAALRVVGYHRHTGGYVDRSYAGEVVPAFAGVPADGFFPGSPPVQGYAEYTLAPIKDADSNWNNTSGVRLAALIKPTAGLTLTAATLMERSHTNDRNAHQPETAGDLMNAIPIRLPLDNDAKLYNLTMNWDLGNTELYASANYGQASFRYVEQFTNVFPANLTSPGTELITWMKSNTNTQEVRWFSKNDGGFNWLVGAWRFDSDNPFRQVMQIQQTQSKRIYDTDSPGTDKQWALFGEISYGFANGLTLTVGARNWHVKQAFGPDTANVDQAIFFLPPKGTGTQVFSYADKLNSYKFNLSYQATPDALYYMQATQGFRLGGFNANPTNDPKVPKQYKTDSLWNYEFGTKGRAADGKLRYSAALYHIRWADMQNRVFVSGAGFNGNAGRAHSDGLEVEAAFKVDEHWELTGNAAYTDARLDEDAPADPNFPTGTEGKAGDRLPGVPNMVWSMGVQYRMASFAASELTLRADLSYVGNSWTRYRADPPSPPTVLDKLGPYTTLNLRATWATEHWEMGAYLNNAFNSRPVVDVYDFLSQQRMTSTLRPRTLGVFGQYRF